MFSVKCRASSETSHERRGLCDTASPVAAFIGVTLGLRVVPALEQCHPTAFTYASGRAQQQTDAQIQEP